MPSMQQGSIRLFRVAGITVFLHWSWFIIALIEINSRSGMYRSPVWNALEYLALFAIVLLHEFGHALACRSVGGRAERIVLWPLGGVAYVSPPQRPGATLWSIAAGPLVNVVLTVPLTLVVVWGRKQNWWNSESDPAMWLTMLWYINIALLVFNILPIYPLDGGQILRALLWFFLGRARSLMIAVVVGVIGVAGLGLLALKMQSIWIGIIAAFALFNCVQGWRAAQAMRHLDKLPRHTEFTCPSCGNSPPAGAFWKCGVCNTVFDTFATNAICPHCGEQFAQTYCVNCGQLHPFAEWQSGTPNQPE